MEWNVRARYAGEHMKYNNATMSVEKALATTASDTSCRPLWYRLAGRAEPLRPLFAWAVEHKRLVIRALLGTTATIGGLLTLLLGRRVGSALRRRR